MKKSCFLLAVIAITLLFAGCGSKKVTIEEAKEKVAELVAKGVPEREMSSITLYMYQMEAAKNTGNKIPYRKYRDSLDFALNELEFRMVSLLEESAPVIDSLRKVVEEKKASLKGLHLESADSLIAIVDSLIGATQPLMARTRLEDYDLEMDTLVMQQKLADSLRNQFVGAWVLEKESPDRRFNVVERTEIHMRRDGSLYILERKKGQTTEHNREDWEFRSTGKWDLKGDVALHYITNDKCVKQNFYHRDPNSGKWIQTVQPTYDSTITDGSKDRYVTYSVLREDFKKFPVR